MDVHPLLKLCNQILNDNALSGTSYDQLLALQQEIIRFCQSYQSLHEQKAALETQIMCLASTPPSLWELTLIDNEELLDDYPYTVSIAMAYPKGEKSHEHNS